MSEQKIETPDKALEIPVTFVKTHTHAGKRYGPQGNNAGLPHKENVTKRAYEKLRVRGVIKE